MSKRERATGRGKACPKFTTCFTSTKLLVLLLQKYKYYESWHHHTCADSHAYAPLPHSRAYAPIVMRMRMLP